MITVISGIDTGIGKTRVTAALAKRCQQQNQPFVTMKLVQTGCVGLSEDIQEHRQLLDMPILKADLEGLTCPYVFEYPASPHLAAERQSQPIDETLIVQAAKSLEAQFQTVWCEGAGGLMVPLNAHRTLLDLVAEQGWPVVLVTSARLGSLNHTLLSLQALTNAGVNLQALVFNHRPDEDPVIATDSAQFLRRRISSVPFLELDWGSLELYES